MNEDDPHLQRTRDLVAGAKQGRRDALETLLARYRPRLERWATGRLPVSARSLLDTGDLVQETLLRALENLDTFEMRGPGAFEAYVRQSLLNRIRDQIRWARRRGAGRDGADNLVDRAPTPLENAIGADVVRRYEDAMAALDPEERQLLHLRIELHMEYEEIATLMGRPSAAAARLAIKRSLHRLAHTMGHAKER